MKRSALGGEERTIGPDGRRVCGAKGNVGTARTIRNFRGDLRARDPGHVDMAGRRNITAQRVC